MPKFRFSVSIGELERVEEREITENKLTYPYSISSQQQKDICRRNVINEHLERWVLEQIESSYEELISNENKTSIQNNQYQGQAKTETDKS